MPASPLLLIVGMHRSGTSLLGSLLPACGITMPGPLIAGDTHNPEGYFERTDVTALQEQLLIDLDRWWPSPRGMQPLPEGWLHSPRGQQALQALIALLEPELARQKGPWAIKDPRSSLLLPLWQAACQQLGIPLQLLLAVRDPAEVMVSLVRRDQAVTGMDGWRAQRLWWHHNAQVLRQGQHLPLQVISYGHWFEPAAALQQLRGLAPQLAEAQRLAALASVRPEHRRSHRQALPAALAPQVQALYTHLQTLALTPLQQQARRRAQLLQWLEHHSALPAEAPLPRRRSRLKRSLQRRLGRSPAPQLPQHPWGYLAEIACGSPGPAAEHQLAVWLAHGFSPGELQGFAALPAPLPAAEPWPAPAASELVQVQVRGADLVQWPAHGWLQHCPIQPACNLTPVPFGQAQAAPVALNLADLLPGPAGASELLHLAGLERVWDPNPQRVQLLRQFGIQASWLRVQGQA